MSRRSTALRDACLPRPRPRRHHAWRAAGVTKRVPTLQMDEADWNRIIETNLTGVRCAPARCSARRWSSSKRGRIITIASLASFIGLHEVAAYTASKAARRRADARARRRVGAVTA